MSSQHTNWKLNQVLLATVINSSSRGKLLRIEGNTYKPLNDVQTEVGKNLQLKVTAFSPFLELAMLDTAKISEKPGIKPAIILSEKFLQQPGLANPNNSSGLLRIMQVLDSLPPQMMSTATAALYTALKQRIVNSGSLTSSRTLKPALRDASLLLEGTLHPDDVGEEEGDLKSLLLHIVRSLGGTDADSGSSSRRGQAFATSGLALYQSVGRAGIELAQLAAKEVEDEFLRMFIFHKPMPDHSDEQGQRWLFELPFRFQDRVRSVSIRIYEEDQTKRAASAAPNWAAQFGFELPNCGHLEIALCITDPAISITIACELVETANLLVHNQQALRHKLASFGLRMTALACTTRATETFASAQPPSAGQTNGTIELTELNMQRNSASLPPLSAIPGLLYCAMATLFGYVLDTEDKIS